MSFLHTKLTTTGPGSVEVVIDGPANVIVMDPLNYYSYCAGGDYSYYGSHFRHTGACRVPAPGRGVWHLVVDSGPVNVKASYRVIS